MKNSETWLCPWIGNNFKITMLHSALENRQNEFSVLNLHIVLVYLRTVLMFIYRKHQSLLSRLIKSKCIIQYYVAE